MKRTIYSLAFLLLIAQQLMAQAPKQYNSGQILHKLQKLNTLGSVLYIAAHPDDENTRLLAYMANEMKLRTGYLSLTRGDGGQNLIGKEQGELLGLIRTQELLAARRIDGAEQFFTRANDFGYSKNPEETFAIWNKDSILADVVWVIRNFKPDVIICRFPTDGRGGHGHHTASAILAEEAFVAAADPNRFPEQLQYTQVWQAKRVFWNLFNFNNTVPDSNAMKMNVGVFNPLLGTGYGEMAAESRSMHKSQGFGSLKARGELYEYFEQMKGDSVPINSGIFAGINTSWERLKGTKKIQQLIDKALKEYNPIQPSLSISNLLGVYKEIQSLDEINLERIYWKKQKLKECEDLIIACSGLWLEAYADNYMAIPGDSITITAEILNQGKSFVSLNKINFLGILDSTVDNQMFRKKMEYYISKLHSYKITQKLPENTFYSNPYWLTEPHSNGLYTVNNQLLRGTPENIPQVKVTFYIEFGDVKFAVERPVVYKYRDPVKGEIYRPLEILPPVSINPMQDELIFDNDSSKTIKLIVKANKNNAVGNIEVSMFGNGWEYPNIKGHYNLQKKGDEHIIEVKITPVKDGVVANILFDEWSGDHFLWSKGIQRLEYDHIPYQFWLKEARVKLVKVPLKKTNITVGYIPGAGDEVAACLRQVGYTVVELTDEKLANDDLKQYGAIVAGIRAYNTNERMALYNTKLMEYVKNGGNYIVQYNTNSRFGPVNTQMGPYKFNISRDRVTDEFAKVEFTLPQHPALTAPNKITGADFDGWVQERGIYFATEVDSNYAAPLSMADPKEKAQTGSLIIAPYGKGNFVYTGLAFFRQLPAGVSGAYRLFVNLLSLPAHE